MIKSLWIKIRAKRLHLLNSLSVKIIIVNVLHWSKIAAVVSRCVLYWIATPLSFCAPWEYTVVKYKVCHLLVASSSRGTLQLNRGFYYILYSATTDAVGPCNLFVHRPHQVSSIELLYCPQNCPGAFTQQVTSVEWQDADTRSDTDTMRRDRYGGKLSSYRGHEKHTHLCFNRARRNFQLERSSTLRSNLFSSNDCWQL